MRILWTIACLSTLVFAGCSKEQKRQARGELERAGEEAGRVAERTGEKVKRAGEEAGRVAERTGESVKARLSDSGLTMRVKTAMAASTKLDISRVNVDTENKVMYLRGSVPDETQRLLAERIAQDTVGDGIIVVNELKIKQVTTVTKRP